LNHYDNEYLVYCDQTNFPYGEKSMDYVLDCIEKAGELLIQK
jgi:glutamate racemase